MIRWTYHYLKGIPSIYIDGTLAALTGCLSFMQGYLTGEEAYKYVNPYVLYWIKFGIGSLAATVGAVFFFRSKAFAEHVAKRKLEELENKIEDKLPII